MEEIKSPLTPLEDKVVLEVLEADEVTQTGNIYIPDMGGENPEYGKVIAVGPGRYSEKGIRIEMPSKLKVGVNVLVPTFGARKVILGGRDYIIASVHDILAIVNDENE